MRKVTFKQKKTIDQSSITNEMLVGVEFSTGDKCVIIKNGNRFMGVNTFDATEDISNNWTSASKREYVCECEREVSEFKAAYVFENTDEMLNWLKNQNNKL